MGCSKEAGGPSEVLGERYTGGRLGNSCSREAGRGLLETKIRNRMAKKLRRSVGDEKVRRVKIDDKKSMLGCALYNMKEELCSTNDARNDS